MNSSLIEQAKMISLRFDDVFYFKEFRKFVEQLLLKFNILEVFREEYHFIFYFKMLKTNFIIMRSDLRLLCVAKTLYQSIALVL